MRRVKKERSNEEDIREEKGESADKSDTYLLFSQLVISESSAVIGHASDRPLHLLGGFEKLLHLFRELYSNCFRAVVGDVEHSPGTTSATDK